MQETTDEIHRHDRAVAHWLLACCLLIFAMVVLGGVTRLTGSGLSMVEWDPLFGILPPLNEAAWLEVFGKYQQSPEYLHVNIGMDLEGFKGIYWFEYAHRVLGRSIGIAFLIPFLYFLARGFIRRGLAPKLIGLFVLGGLQGLMGWYMVKSGLVDVPQVSQYRLAAHLSLAFVIYAYMLWIALDLLHPRRLHARIGAFRDLALLTGLCLLLASITVVSGAFVAGLKAGYAYNTFPLMGEHWVPEEMFALEPVWRNFFENIATVQFDHRLLAMTTAAAIIALWVIALCYPLSRRLRFGYHLLLAAVAGQVTLGVATLLSHVDITLASVHQAGALTLVTVLIYVLQGVVRGEMGHGVDRRANPEM